MFLKLLHKYGKTRVIATYSILIAVTCGIVCAIILQIFQGYIDTLGMVLSIGMPLLASLIIFSTFSSFLLQLEEARKKLEKKNQELTKAQQEVKSLTGLLPICASCKKIKDDKGYWNQLETYIIKHSDAIFSHGLCNECAEKFYKDANLQKDLPVGVLKTNRKIKDKQYVK